MLTRYDILALFVVTLLFSVVVMSRTGLGQETRSLQKKAVFAAGCFWCIEKEMESVKGVIGVVSGYTGGDTENPTYEQVSSGATGHREAVLVTYDSSVVRYEDLLEVFWDNIDPLNAEGQFCDLGTQYTSAIFYGDAREKALAQKTRQERQERVGQTIITDILPAAVFYEAEDYHQDFYKKNPFRYRIYREQCRRDQRLEDLWGE